MANRTRIGGQQAVKSLTGWSPAPNRDAIRKRFEFPDFKSAWAFMTRVAEFADRTDHHPEWTNVYNRVEVELTTHDAGGVTELDVQLALFMDAAAAPK